MINYALRMSCTVEAEPEITFRVKTMKRVQRSKVKTNIIRRFACDVTSLIFSCLNWSGWIKLKCIA